MEETHAQLTVIQEAKIYQFLRKKIFFQVINLEVRFFFLTLNNDQGIKPSLALFYSVNENHKNLLERTECKYGMNVFLMHHH